MAPKKKETTEIMSIDLICKQLQKKYGGEEVLFCLDEDFVPPEIEVVDTGVSTLNEALGVWGWPVGRIIEVFGKESAGKTTLVTQALARTQEKFPEKKIAYIDVEHSFDKAYARKLGLDLSSLIFSQPSSMERALDIVEALCESGQVSAIAIDSVSAMAPQKELEGDMDESTMGLHARIMSKAMRKLKGKSHKTDTTLFFINQVRSGIGPYAGETTFAGKSLSFYSSIRIRVRKLTDILLGGEAVGINVEAQVKKNKVAPPFKTAVLPLYFGKGFSSQAAIVSSAIDKGIINKRGSWLTYKDHTIQGVEKLVAMLESDPELLEKITQEYKEMVTNKKIIEVTSEKEEASDEKD